MENISRLLSKGDSFYIDENYLLALRCYNEAWRNAQDEVDATELGGSCDARNPWLYLQFQILSHRANAHIILDNFREAYDDLYAAITSLLPSLSVTSSGQPFTFEKYVTYKRMGVALYELDRVAEAKSYFELALQSATSPAQQSDGDEYFDHEKKESECNQWLEKIHKKLANVQGKAEGGADDVKHGAKPQMKRIPPPPAQNVVTKPSRPTVPKYQYYQNDNYVTIAILEPKVNGSDLRVEYGDEGKTLTVRLRKGGIDLTVICGTLFDSVTVDKCKIKFLDEKVLLKLKKAVPHTWHELMSKVPAVGGTSTPLKTSKTIPSEQGNTKSYASSKTDMTKDHEMEESSTSQTFDYVSSRNSTSIPNSSQRLTRPYSSNRDWNAIEREISIQEAEEKPEGEEALNKLFQQIYGNASEDTRRAMVKSFQTSGGTVLSTNWEEVSKTDYEKQREAPKGMEWKTWEGNKMS
jgi:hypothetical protein